MRSLLVAGGAALGANARYWLGAWASNRFGPDFPWGTLIINATGSFLIGAYLCYDQARGGAQSARLFIAVGMCGGYTTFSTFSWETLKLLQSGNYAGAFANMAGSALLTVFACWLGFVAARAILGA